MKKISFITATAIILLSACKTTKPLYYHGTYQSNLYEHFKAEEVSIEEQISQLHQTIELASTENLPIAPGIQAHLGYLYLKSNNIEHGLDYLKREKVMYPESTKYIDFLISNVQGG